MRLARLYVLLLLSCFVLFRPLARAYDFPPISDEEMKFASVPGHPGAPAAILYREEIDEDDKNHDHITYMRIKILTEAGRRYADVDVPFDRTWSNIEDVSARTIHADGTIATFDGKILDKIIVKGHGLKIHAKTFTLPDVQVGSIIEYRYFFRYHDNLFVAPHWILQSELWQKKVHFKFTPTFHELIMRHGLVGHGVAWTTFAPKELQPQETVRPDGVSWIELNGSDVPPFIEEPHMATSDQFKYNVHFYYVVNPKQEDFWKQEGKYWSKDVEKFINKSDGVSAQVQQLITATDTPEQKVRKIYAFVGGLENLSYMPRRTEQEQQALGLKEVRGAADAVRQKSGDRDDLTRLFVAMVRAAGIPAYVMAVTSRQNNYFEPAYLSPEQLDAEIAIVVLNGKEVFLDPGSKFCPYGILDWKYSATEGVRQTDKGTAIAQTPAPSYAEAITQRLGRFVMNDDGAIEGTMKVIFYGQEALSRRQSAIRTDDEGRKKDLEDEVRGWLPAGADVKLLQPPNWDSSGMQLAATFHVSTAIASNAGRRVLLPLHVFQINETPMFPSAERENGVYLYYPSREVDEVSVTLPASLEIENLPQNDNVHVDYAIYKTEWSQQQRTVTARRDLAMAGFVFPVKNYKELKAFYDKVKAGDEQQAVLKVNANASGK